MKFLKRISIGTFLGAVSHIDAIQSIYERCTNKNENVMYLDVIKLAALIGVMIFLVFKYFEVRDKIKAFDVISRIRLWQFVNKGVSATDKVKGSAYMHMLTEERENVFQTLATVYMKEKSAIEINKILDSFYDELNTDK